MTKNLTSATVIAFSFILVMLILQATTQFRVRLPEVERKPESCVGEPLFVDYPFEGGYIDDHACAVQCEDRIQRYIMYRNNRATQCELLPGCLDKGEDSGQTCEPPTLESKIN